jgi:phosphohistidine swiveling domain-containing protein
VTAREMRVPAVMSVRSAMDVLANGQEVTLDGTAGTVSISAVAERQAAL